MHSGRIQCVQTPECLIRDYTGYHLKLTEHGSQMELEPESPQEALRVLKCHSCLESFEFRTDTLDDIFVKLIGSPKGVIL